MGWLELRSAIEAQISVFETTLRQWHGHQTTLADARSRLHTTLDSSNHPLARNGLQTADLAPGHAGQATDHLTRAIQLCRDYLNAVDPDGANGSTRGLEPPQPRGTTHGGHGGPHVPPARQPITDPSRRRSHVYPEQGPDGLADLQDRDDGIVTARADWLRCGGHAVDRHGGAVTDQQLQDRALHGHDPMTGNPVDWEWGANHPHGRDATAFATDTDLVYAEMCTYDSRPGQAERAAAEAAGRYEYSVLIPASSVFGLDFRDHLRGWSRIGSAKHPQGVQPTSFTDGTQIFVRYVQDPGSTQWVAWTCYAKP
jgi:hypothetical protein